MTSPLVFVAIALAGGVGAALRLVVDGVVRSALAQRRQRVPGRTGVGATPFPVATAVINVTGSFALGLLTGLAASHGLPHAWLLIAGGGLIGGYTTFSTASVETARLLTEGAWRPGLLNGLGVLVLAVGAALLGLALSS